MQLDLYGNRMLPASDSTLIKIDGKFNPTIHVNNNKKKEIQPSKLFVQNYLPWNGL